MPEVRLTTAPRSTRLLKAAVISYLGLAAGFGSSVVASRTLGVEGKGIFSLFMVTVSGLWLVAALGVPQGQLYHASKDPRWLTYFMKNGVLFSIVIGGVVGLGYFVGARSLGFGPVTALPLPTILAGIVAVPAGVLLMYQRQYFFALHRFELAKASGALALTLPLVSYVVLSIAGFATVPSFAVAFVLSLVLCFVVFQPVARQVGPLSSGFSRDFARRSLSFGSRQYASALALYLMERVDVFIVLHYLGGRGLGIYSVAVALAEITTRLSNEIGTILFPIFASPTLKSGQAAAALRIVTLFAVCVAAILAVLSGPLVHLLFGPQFEGATPVFRWLLIGTVAWSTTHVTWSFLSASGRPELGTFGFGFATLVDVVLNMLLLPRWGVVGAGIAATASYLTAALLFLYFFRKAQMCTLREALIPRGTDLLLLRRAVRGFWDRSTRRVVEPLPSQWPDE
ncbi:MAG: flippase [Gemmatimonadaceae bacterium]